MSDVSPEEWSTDDVLSYLAVAVGDLAKLLPKPNASYRDELFAVATVAMERARRIREASLAGPCDQCADLIAFINRPGTRTTPGGRDGQ